MTPEHSESNIYLPGFEVTEKSIARIAHIVTAAAMMKLPQRCMDTSAAMACETLNIIASGRTAYDAIFSMIFCGFGRFAENTAAHTAAAVTIRIWSAKMG